MGVEDLKIAQLSVFMAVAELRSLRAVSRKLGTSPSHVSKLIARLESKIGQQLTARTPRGIILTRNGVDFLAFAKTVAETADNWRQGTAKGPAAEKRLITIGSITYIARHTIAPAIELLDAKLPGVRWRIIDIPPDRLAEAAIKGNCDIAVIVGRAHLTQAWKVVKLGDIPWILVARKGHPLGTEASESEVLRHAFVVPSYWRDDEYIVGNDFCPTPLRKRILGHEVSSADTALEICRHTDQLTFVPMSAARTYIKLGVAIEVRVPSWERITKPLYLAAHGDKIKKSELDILKIALNKHA